MQNFLKGAAMFVNFAGTLSIKGIVWDISVCEINIKLKKEYSFWPTCYNWKIYQCLSEHFIKAGIEPVNIFREYIFTFRNTTSRRTLSVGEPRKRETRNSHINTHTFASFTLAIVNFYIDHVNTFRGKLLDVYDYADNLSMSL